MIFCKTTTDLECAERLARDAGYKTRMTNTRLWVNTGDSVIVHVMADDPDAVTVGNLRSELADSQRDTRESKAVQP